MSKKFTKEERSWILYDVGNSAFSMMISTLIPIWFETLIGEAYDATTANTIYVANWSYATSIATIAVALIGPIIGTLADNRGFKKKLFMTVLLISVCGTAFMGLSPNWIIYMVLYITTKVAYQSSLVVYDSMINDVTTTERLDLVSAQGFAMGYIGSCIPFLAALVLYFLGLQGIIPIKIAIVVDFILVAVWWFGSTVPLLKNYKQIHYVTVEKGAVAASFKRLGYTLVHMYKTEKKVFCFLIAFFFYIDGVATIIDEAVVIGRSLGLDTMGLLVVLLLTQVVAFFFASLFGRLSEKYETVKLIKVCILGYTFVAVFALFMTSLWQFGVMAFIVGMFQGAIQALSRSYYAQIIPADTSGEYFGIYDICGKGAAFMGTTLIGITVTLTNSVNIAIATLTVLFVAGFFLLSHADKMSA